MRQLRVLDLFRGGDAPPSRIIGLPLAAEAARRDPGDGTPERERAAPAEDDGEGFEPGEIPDGQNTDGEDGNRAEGVGLRSMKERTEMLGGRLEISSKPGGGTAVEVRLPLTD